MGPPEISPENPKNYLRKHSGKTGQVLKDKPAPPNMTNMQSRLPKPVTIPKRRRTNFIRKNVLNVKKIEFTEPEPKYVDTRDGSRHYLEDSGYKLKYSINKGKYGLLPKYLVKRMVVQQLCDKAEQDDTEIVNLPKCRYITRQEREELLQVRRLI